jgi:hypothetical protein
VTEPLLEGRPPDTLHDAVSPTPEIERKNVRFVWGLVGLVLLLFGGTFLIGLTYLWLD